MLVGFANCSGVWIDNLYRVIYIRELSSDMRRVPHLKQTLLVILEVLHITDMIFQTIVEFIKHFKNYLQFNTRVYLA